MNIIKKTAALALIALASACATERASVATWGDIAEQVVPREQVADAAAAMARDHGEQSDATWFNLCNEKNCDAASLEYSRLFREAALLSSAVRHSERLGASPAQFTDLQNRVGVLKIAITWFDPIEDLSDEGSRLQAERGLKLAQEQIDSAARRLHHVAPNYGTTLASAK